ncbi:hypothetical protein ACOME3_006277 [Neoechinorhynchus agilis]
MRCAIKIGRMMVTYESVVACCEHFIGKLNGFWRRLVQLFVIPPQNEMDYGSLNEEMNSDSLDGSQVVLIEDLNATGAINVNGDVGNSFHVLNNAGFEPSEMNISELLTTVKQQEELIRYLTHTIEVIKNQHAELMDEYFDKVDAYDRLVFSLENVVSNYKNVKDVEAEIV